jgi:hypothetical protein
MFNWFRQHDLYKLTQPMLVLLPGEPYPESYSGIFIHYLAA